MLVEVDNTCCFNTVGTITVVNGVEVHIKNLVLSKLLLHLNRDVSFADLTLQRALKLLVRKNGITNKLLRNSGSTFAATKQRANRCANNTPGVNTAVGIEALILSINGALNNIRRNLIQGNRATLLQIEVSNVVTLGVINAGRLCYQIGISRVVIWQVLEP